MYAYAYVHVIMTATIRIRREEDEWWIDAPDNYAQAFHIYRDAVSRIYKEAPYETSQLKIYRTNNNPYYPSYVYDKITNKIYPIVDWTDVKVFLIDVDRPDWYPARDYQTWAYYNFMYSENRTNLLKKKYASGGSLSPRVEAVTTINVRGLLPGIIFSISRNENGSVYYEKNDLHQTRVRICDSEYARIGFRGFYSRMTMDVGMIITPPPQPQPLFVNTILPFATETSIEENQCIMCFTFIKNIQFMPCLHNVICTNCYPSLQNKTECPICRGHITDIHLV